MVHLHVEAISAFRWQQTWKQTQQTWKQTHCASSTGGKCPGLAGFPWLLEINISSSSTLNTWPAFTVFGKNRSRKNHKTDFLRDVSHNILFKKKPHWLLFIEINFFFHWLKIFLNISLPFFPWWVTSLEGYDAFKAFLIGISFYISSYW